MSEAITLMCIFWILMMLTIIITNRSIRDNAKESVKEVIVKTNQIRPNKETGVEVITNEMEIDIEEGVKNEYFKTRY